MSYIGDRALGATVDFKFTTSVNGVPTALAGSPAISVYQGGSTTPITSGVTLTGSYNSTTGLNDVSIVASAGNGFAAGFDYQVEISTGTLGGVSMVGFIVGEFSINLENVANLDSQAVSASGTVTFPATIASPTNITAGTITTVTNLTNAPTAGDLTATMKTSVTTAATAATPTAAAVTGNVGGNVVGSVGSVVGAVGSVTARVTANSDQIAGSATAATNSAAVADAVGRGTVTTGATTTSIPTSAMTPSGAALGQFGNNINPRTMTFDKTTATAALQGQSTVISNSSNAANPTFTVNPLTTAPSAGDTFSVT